jgi:hypothetical protein
LIDEEGIAIASVPPFQPAGINGTELDAPKTNRFSADRDASFSEQVFNVAVAQVEAIIEPDSITDDVGWESMALIW